MMPSIVVTGEMWSGMFIFTLEFTPDPTPAIFCAKKGNYGKTNKRSGTVENFDGLDNFTLYSHLNLLMQTQSHKFCTPKVLNIFTQIFKFSLNLHISQLYRPFPHNLDEK